MSKDLLLEKTKMNVPFIASTIVIFMFGVLVGVEVWNLRNLAAKANSLGAYMKITEQLATYGEVLAIVNANYENEKIKKQAAASKEALKNREEGIPATPKDPDATIKRKPAAK